MLIRFGGWTSSARLLLRDSVELSSQGWVLSCGLVSDELGQSLRKRSKEIFREDLNHKTSENV
jgi:hypothetical protein